MIRIEFHLKSEIDPSPSHCNLSRNEMDDVPGDEIADMVLSQYATLPKKAKPLIRGGGLKEWVPMSGIVAQGFYFLPHGRFELFN